MKDEPLYGESLSDMEIENLKERVSRIEEVLAEVLTLPLLREEAE